LSRSTCACELKNFASLKIGRNFVEIKGSWRIALSAAEPKEDRPDERRIDDLLQPALDRYLKKYMEVVAAFSESLASFGVFDGMLGSMRRVPLHSRVSVTTVGASGNTVPESMITPISSLTLAAQCLTSMPRCRR
jgi:hypothetical protein